MRDVLSILPSQSRDVLFAVRPASRQYMCCVCLQLGVPPQRPTYAARRDTYKALPACHQQSPFIHAHSPTVRLMWSYDLACFASKWMVLRNNFVNLQEAQKCFKVFPSFTGKILPIKETTLSAVQNPYQQSYVMLDKS